MNKTLLTLWILAALPVAALAQDRIYRCGNEYTNNATQAKERGCKLVEGGNVTVIQGSRPSGGGGASSGGSSASSSASSSSPAGAPPLYSLTSSACLVSALRNSDSRMARQSAMRWIFATRSATQSALQSSRRPWPGARAISQASNAS